MRCPVEKIKEALLSPSYQIRNMALLYFANSFSDDADLMPLVIRSIELFNDRKTWGPYNYLHRLKQSDQSIEWIVGELAKSNKQNSSVRYRASISETLAFTDVNLLAQWKDRIFECRGLEERFLAIVKDRLKMAAWDQQKCQAEFELFLRRDMKYQINERTENRFHSFVSILALDGRTETARVLQAVERPYHKDLTRHEISLLVANAELAGLMKLEAAIEPIAKLFEEDSFVDEITTFTNALVQIGSLAVVNHFAENYDSRNDLFKMSAAEILGNIKCDESVVELQRMLEKETNPELREIIISSLLDQLDPEVLSQIYEVLQAEDLQELDDLKSRLVRVAELTNTYFDGYESLKAEVVEAEIRQPSNQVLNEELEFIYMGEADKAAYERKMAKQRPAIVVKDSAIVPETTVLKDSDRVGRNDPCPCGSGKKFKKCCINKSGA